MRMRDMQKILLAGIFCAGSAIAEGIGPEANAGSAAGAQEAKEATDSGKRAAPSQQGKTEEFSFLRKKKTAQTPAPMLDEKNLGLGCAKP